MSVCVRVHVPALRKVNIRMCGSIWGAWGLTLSRTVKTKRNVCLFVCFVCLNTHMFLYLSVTWTRTRSAVHVPYFWVTSALNRLKTWNPSCVSFHVRSPGWMMMMMMSRFALERRHGARSSSTLAGIHISPSASETRSCRLFTSRSGDFSSSCPPHLRGCFLPPPGGGGCHLLADVSHLLRAVGPPLCNSGWRGHMMGC